MYLAYGLLTPASKATLDAAAAKLAAVFPDLRTTRTEGSIVFAGDAWEFVLTWREGPEVLEGSQEIAERIGGTEDELGLRTCSRRIEAASDVPDPEMEHFADYLKVVETLKTFPGLIAVDPKEPSLL